MRHFEGAHRRFGNIRLLVVIATLIAAWFSFYRDAFSAVVAASCSHSYFSSSPSSTQGCFANATCAERAVDFYRKGLARIEDRWIDSDKPGTGQTGTRIDVHSSLYATDLDLFGPGSLFELLSLARTRMGEDTLATWLLSPSPVAQLTQRHAAVAELRSRLDLREDIAILGEDIKVGIHPEALTPMGRGAQPATSSVAALALSPARHCGNRHSRRLGGARNKDPVLRHHYR